MRSHIKNHGFTLIELLAVMALMSLVMLGMLGAMRSMGQTENRIDHRVSRSDEFRTAVSFLQSVLSRVSDKKLEQQQAGLSTFPFVSGDGYISWVGTMPARFGSGGKSYFRLMAEPLESNEVALVLRFAPWLDSQGWPDWARSQSVVLVNNLVGIRFRFQDDRTPSLMWKDEWSSNERLPNAIAMSIQTKSEEWPELVVVLRDMNSASNRRSSVGLGGGGG